MTIAASAGPSPAQFIAIRVVEYAFLGWAVGSLSARPRAGLRVYALVGLATGVAAAAIVVLLSVRAAAPEALPLFALVSKCVNELLFPLGCSLVLYAVNALGSRVRLAAAV